MTKTIQQNWFEHWFNSKYYHILYDNRNHDEAALFLSHIIQFLKIKNNATILDLACGEGRHSKFLAQKGFDVTGVDLSENSIKNAKQFESPNLKFMVKDMRYIDIEHSFDYVFNLFTSFGYFEKVSDNLKTLSSINSLLIPNGILLIDFLNEVKVKNELIHREEIKKGETIFYIERKIESGKVIKSISFEAEGKKLQFEEKVQLFDLKDFSEMLTKCGFRLLNTFGNYDLDAFDENNSSRLIMIAEKINRSNEN